MDTDRSIPQQFNERTADEQLKVDIKYLKKNKITKKKEINQILKTCETFDVPSAQYFVEEWLFLPFEETEEGFAKTARLHDEDYLNIAVFNGIHWGSNNED